MPSPTNNTIEMYMCINHHGFTADRIKQMKRETTADPTLALAYHFGLSGWPDNRRYIPHIAQRYWVQCDEWSTDHGILIK